MLAAAITPIAAQNFDCPQVERQVKLTAAQTTVTSVSLGQTVNYGVFVEPVNNTPDPTGTIQLVVDTTNLGTFNLKQSQTSFSTVFTIAGAHQLFVTYSGDFNYCAAAITFSLTVSRLGTSLSLASSTATSTPGAPVTFTTQIAPATPKGIPDPTGEVQFLDGATAIGSVTPVASKASLTVSNLSGGTHQITAVYSGDANWFLLRSAAVPVTVNRIASTTAFSARATTTDATLTATVTGNVAGAAAPGGSVQFMDTVANTPVATATLSAGSTAATLNATQIAAAAGHPIAAVYLGDANYVNSSSSALEIPVLINSASGVSSSFAAEEQVSLFGSTLASSTQLGPLPLPTSLGNVTVNVTDSTGVARPGGLILVSPSQLNFLMPAGLAAGAATVAVTAANVSVVPLQVTIVPIAPGIYSAGSNGKGLAAAQIVRVHADGTQTVETVSSAPINFGSDTLYLVLYGTGIRGRSAITNVTCTVGAATLPVAFAGAQTQYPGLDQVDVLLPPALAGSGQVNVTVTVDNQISNVVTIML